jgi:hypothetical protein
VTVRKADTNVRTERTRSGKTMIRIDSDSPTFGADLTYAFQQNVKRARAENKRLFGSPDGLPPKPKPN